MSKRIKEKTAKASKSGLNPRNNDEADDSESPTFEEQTDAVEHQGEDMSKRTKAKTAKTSKIGLSPSSQSQKVRERNVLSLLEEQNEAVEQEGEEAIIPSDLSRQEDPLSRPGAHRVPGIYPSLPFQGSDSSSQEGTEGDVAVLQVPEPDTSSVPQLSAKLVDEAAEEQRQQRYEHESRRNRELESQIRKIQSDAVVAVPVAVEDIDRPMPSTSRGDRSRTDCFQSRKRRLCFAGVVLVVVAAIVGSVLGALSPIREPPVPAIQSSCPSQRYYFHPAMQHLSWSDHNVGANLMGCTLASITTPKEQEEVEALFADDIYDDERIWIGAAPIPGTREWQWTDGSVWGYTNWHVGEPNNAGNENRVLLDTRPIGERYWNDVSGEFEYAAVYKCCLLGNPPSGQPPEPEKEAVTVPDLIEVSGAGSTEVNGLYKKVDTSVYTGDAILGPLLWRQTTESGFSSTCIINIDESWWIGDLQDATADYYYIESGDPNVPPVEGSGMTWQVADSADDWTVGEPPVPKVEAAVAVPDLIEVSGAGSTEVNGLYKKVDTSVYTGDAILGPLLWRQTTESGFSSTCIINIDESWWIGDLQDATADYYYIESGDPNVPPVEGSGMTWQVADSADDWTVGEPPVPKVEAAVAVPDLIEVSGAGSTEVNGLYKKVDTSVYTGDAILGPLLWRQTTESGFSSTCIINIDESWWIGDLQDATADYYYIESGDPNVPPVEGSGMTWQVADSADDWSVGEPPVPKVEAVTVPDMIEVSGAGSTEVNGLYKKVDTGVYTGDGILGPLLWRQTTESGFSSICIIHIDESWWIGDLQDATADYYYIKSGDPNVPPVEGSGMTWQVADFDNDWSVGEPPVPNVEAAS